VVWEYLGWSRLGAAHASTTRSQGFTKQRFRVRRAEDWVKSAKFTEDRSGCARGSSRGLRHATGVRLVVTNAIDALNQETVSRQNARTRPTHRRANRFSFHAIRCRRRSDRDSRTASAGCRRRSTSRQLTGAQGRGPRTPSTRSVGAWKARRSLLRIGATPRHTRSDYIAARSRSARPAAWCARGEELRSSRPRYRIGGGALGNVNANTTTSLGRAAAYIEAVTNPLPATAAPDARPSTKATNRARTR